MSMSKEQQLTERAGVIIRSIEGGLDPSSLDRLYEEYDGIVDELYLVRMPPKNTFALLPAELKYRIFEEFCLSTEGGPFLLSRVCKQWLQLSRQNSALWTKIIIMPTESQWLEHLKLYSRLSGERMLDITVRFPLTEDDIQKIEACTDFTRWRSLSVLKGRPNYDRIVASRIILRISGPSRLLSLLRRDPFPQLKDINIRIRAPNASSPYLWSNLFEWKDDLAAIVSDFTKSTLLSHLTVNLRFTGFDHLLQTLSESPNLTYLKLSTQRRDAERVSRPVRTTIIPLHKLRELRMENNGLGLLLAIEYPKLEILSCSAVSGELQDLRMRLLTLTSLKELDLRLRGPDAGNSPTTLKVQGPPLTTLTQLTLVYFAGTGLNASWSSINHDDVHHLLELFPEARQVKLVSGMETFDWPRAIKIFSKVEQMEIEQAKNDLISRTNRAYQEFLSSQPPLSFMQNVPDLSSLVSLRVEGRACNAVLCAFSASRLQTLVMAETKDLAIDIFLAFIERSPVLYKLRLEGIYLATPSIKDSPLSLQHLTFEEATTVPSSIQDLHIMHDAIPILQRVSLPYLHTLRLMGVLQGVSVQRSNHHFNQREIRLADLLRDPGFSLHNLITLDLCASNALLPIVAGLLNILPHLVSLKSISLPRELQVTNVLVDVLIEKMCQENDGAYTCPRLTDIQTEDYPEWEGLLDLLALRNRSAHIKQEDITRALVPAPIECLRLPGLPHSSILYPLQVALAGKFSPRQRSDSAEATSAQGCDNCALTGWKCLERSVDKAPYLRSSCSRHRHGPVRVTADS